MSLESNSGTQYYPISCGIPSDVGVDTESNSFTGYFYKEPNDYILWGQVAYYAHVSSNIGSNPYFLQCDVPSDSGLDLESNKDTKYYYSSSFNCVGFCDGLSAIFISGGILSENGFYILDETGEPILFDE
jgi:hypothetical protein